MKLIIAVFGALLPPTSASAQTTFTNKPDLQNAADLWCSNETAALAAYGNIASWDVSRITDLSCLFSAWSGCPGGSTTGKSTCNPDIGSWVTSAVTTMGEMFFGATAFDKDISSWNTSAVLYMDFMFHGASSFDKDISSWDTSAVLDMSHMFYGATSFDKDLSSWDVSAALNMDYMFHDATSLSDCNKALMHASFDAQTIVWDYRIVGNSWGSLACPPSPPASPPPLPPPPSASPSPPPPPPSDPPCFPSSATVQRADGATAPLSSLSAGDSILAAAADGTLGFDVVSSFSLADPSAKAAFLSLATATATVALTPTHKLPAGPAKALKQASEVAVGETIWLASPAAGTLVQAPVLKITKVVADGLHSPLTMRGGWPVVDGVATSYNSPAVVARNKYLVPLVEAVCPSLGRLVVAAVNPKPMHYIDGEVVEPISSLEVAAAVAVTAAATLGVRKITARK